MLVAIGAVGQEFSECIEHAAPAVKPRVVNT
jgi:hypothetical protein